MKTINREQYSPELVLQSGDVFFVPGSFDARFVAVYGTLRLGQGNWSRLLMNTSTYVETRKIPGIIWHGGLAASYVGTEPEQEWCTLDIFEIKGEENSDEYRSTNYRLDSLEGSLSDDPWYMATAIPLEINGKMEVVKFYHLPNGGKAPIQDRLLTHYTPEELMAEAERLAVKGQENMGKFYSYYQKLSNAEEAIAAVPSAVKKDA
jgi:gamma-glutamylcyclotransferase (GGCT)/AIG2-like uncharacterized protein YtfP